MRLDKERLKQKFVERFDETQGLVMDILNTEKLSQAQQHLIMQIAYILDRDYTGDEALCNLQLLDTSAKLLEAIPFEQEEEYRRKRSLANIGGECYAAIN